MDYLVTAQVVSPTLCRDTHPRFNINRTSRLLGETKYQQRLLVVTNSINLTVGRYILSEVTHKEGFSHVLQVQ